MGPKETFEAGSLVVTVSVSFVLFGMGGIWRSGFSNRALGGLAAEMQVIRRIDVEKMKSKVVILGILGVRTAKSC